MEEVHRPMPFEGTHCASCRQPWPCPVARFKPSTDDPGALVEEARAIHKPWYPKSGIACDHCTTDTNEGAVYDIPWPCLPARLADALEAARTEATALRAAVDAAKAVSRFSTPPDNRRNCYFCNYFPHLKTCAWMELAAALRSEDEHHG